VRAVPPVDPRASALAARWTERLNRVLASCDGPLFAALFSEDGYWKDFLSLTGTYRTFGGREEIGAAWADHVGLARPANARLAVGRIQPRAVRRAARNLIEFYVDFDTAQGRATSFVRLLDSDSDSADRQVWILLTTLQELRGYEERTGEHRPTGLQYSRTFAGDSWLDERCAEQRFDDREPEVLIVGAGQGGLVLGARLRQLGVDALIVEANERVGDNWRRRYHSLTLHNEVWTNSLPYMPFPDTWPVFVPKDKLAGWLEAYAEAMELNVWTSTRMTAASYDEGEARWTVTVRLGDGTVRTVQPPHLVMAIGGAAGAPFMPQIPGADAFQGEIVHSSTFTTGISYKGKHAVVIGTGTSAHDVAQDLYENGAARVTMVQRGPTAVVSLVPSGTMVYAIYSEGPAEDIDLAVAATPYPVLRETYQWLTKRTCEVDKDLLDGLRRVGFQLDFGEDNTGFHMMHLRKGGGYYINVGCSDLIAAGKIDLLQSERMKQFVATGVETVDGSVIPADIVVMGTGYANLQIGIGDYLGPEVAEKVGPVWGFDENYIMRNMWQPTGQPGLWIMGGTLSDARLYSRFLALHLIAELRGIDLPRCVHERDPRYDAATAISVALAMAPAKGSLDGARADGAGVWPVDPWANSRDRM
jgi:Pyridine nucleotide-disulphide oxidoreductase